MKKIYLFLFVIFFAAFVKAQVPQGFTYQAVIRSADGTIITNHAVKIKIRLTDKLGTTTYYTEEHSKTTSQQGVCNIVIGEGDFKQGKFNEAPWQFGEVYLKIEVDPTGTSGYQSLGDAVKFNSVPYALYANNIKEVTSQSNATDEEPIFVVKNKAGQIVFAVYQSGVRVNVDNSPVIKGARGGFAVGGLSQTKAGTTPEYLLITPDSARVYTNNSAKGARGGFAVGGLSQTKSGSVITYNSHPIILL